MEENKFKEKTIGQLQGLKFVIPAYQRGYRWTETEVKALLNDINDFKDENGEKQYCIQPLIVRWKAQEGKYEVVDGQQRLTTIYICLKKISEMFREGIKISKIPYELEYATRPESKNFLENISSRHNDDSNIDFYYMGKAYEVIEEWLNTHSDSIFTIWTKLINYTVFIWNEIPENSKPIEMFTKINLGRIKLTNSELIKALLLSKDNFKCKNVEKEEYREIEKQQSEISSEWNKVEQGLQNDLFWSFLSNKEPTGPRIDMIFDLLADDYNEFGIDKKEKNYSFLVFYEIFKRSKNKAKLAKDIWNSVNAVYEEFLDWYNDLNKYHIVGYLTSIGKSLKEIYDISNAKSKKSEVESEFIRKIEESASIKKVYNPEIDEKNPYIDLYYNKSNDKHHIRNILLFFNIATLYCKSEKQYRFPFDLYHYKEKWDIEHIHATHSEEEGEADDNIQNLTLLDYKTNREYDYSNKPFSEKRKKIIEKDSNGRFVPICTKNVFLKVYSKEIINDIWDDDAKNDYMIEMIKKIKEFFEYGKKEYGGENNGGKQ